MEAAEVIIDAGLVRSGQALAKQSSAPPVPAEASVFSAIERIMTDPNASVERANQAFEFYQKVEAERARKAYLEAKAAFKANAPAIFKDKENKQYSSKYASIGNVVNTVNEALGKHDLDASWEYEQGDRIKVTCILRHALGHAERVSLSAPPDTSGAKNPLQQIKSTLTYLRLATFEAVTGIATKEGAADDDGKGAYTETSVVTDDQADELRDLITKTKTDLNKFLEVAKAESVPDVLAKDFPRLKQLLVSKLKGAKQ